MHRNRKQKSRKQPTASLRAFNLSAIRRSGITTPLARDLKAVIAGSVYEGVAAAARGGRPRRETYGDYLPSALYAVVGAKLATALTGKRYVPQAGVLYLVDDPANPARLLFVCREGEYHVWAVGPVADEDHTGELRPGAEIVECGAGLFKGLYLARRGDGWVGVMPWGAADPPKYLWGEPPSWMDYRLDAGATERLWRYERTGALRDHVDRAGEYFKKRWPGLFQVNDNRGCDC
jgi:hypothetical protein